jgi:hypothetical protein
MATVYAISGLPTKNNSGSVLHAGNVTRADMSNLTLAENGSLHPQPRVVASATANIGTTKAISGGVFAYDNEGFIAKVLTGTINGSTNTVLRSGASSVGSKRTDKPTPYERLDITSWDYVSGSDTVGGGAGDSVLVSGIDNVTGARADNGVYQAEFTHSGPGVTPTNNDYPTRNG